MVQELEVRLNIGCPASGKSSFTKSFIEENPNWVRVSRDDFRYMLKNSGACEYHIENMITELENQAILSALRRKLNVIVDDTNLKSNTINDLIELVTDYAKVTYMIFDVPKEVLLERDAARERSVGVECIDKMWSRWEILKNTFSFQPVPMNRNVKQILPNFKSELPNAVIFDIDGTLAVMRDRGPYEWNRVGEDDVNIIVSEQVDFHISMGRKIFIVSGRDESCRKLTEEWLELHNIKYDALFMRPEGSFEKDSVVKRRIYENEFKDKYNILCVFDDRMQVLDMWFKEGVYTFSCNQGSKIF